MLQIFDQEIGSLTPAAFFFPGRLTAERERYPMRRTYVPRQIPARFGHVPQDKDDGGTSLREGEGPLIIKQIGGKPFSGEEGGGKAISTEEEEGEIPKFVERRKQPSSAPFVKEEGKRRHYHHHHLLGHYPLRRIHQEWFLLPPIMPRKRETSFLPQPFRSAMLMVAQVAHSKRQGEVFVCTTPTEGREGGRALIL